MIFALGLFLVTVPLFTHSLHWVSGLGPETCWIFCIRAHPDGHRDPSSMLSSSWLHVHPAWSFDQEAQRRGCRCSRARCMYPVACQNLTCGQEQVHALESRYCAFRSVHPLHLLHPLLCAACMLLQGDTHTAKTSSAERMGLSAHPKKHQASLILVPFSSSMYLP